MVETTSVGGKQYSTEHLTTPGLLEQMMSPTNLYNPLWWMDQQRKFWKLMTELTRPLSTPPWTTPNTIDLALDSVLLRNFSNDRSNPNFKVLILPPQAGHHSSIADYGPGQSLVEAALHQRASVYVTEWRAPGPERSSDNIDTFLASTHACVEAISPDKKPITLIGLCQGGWQSAIYTALHSERVNNLVLAAAPIDFLAGNGKIQTYAEAFPMPFYESLVAMGGGNLPGRFMLMGFKMLNAFDRYVKDPFDAYEHIDDAGYMQRYSQFRNWYEWTQDLPGAFYLQVVEHLFKGNSLIKGELEALGQRVDLSRITCPMTLLAGSKDDITVEPQLFNAEHYVGTKDVVKMTVPAGHIGVFMAKEVVRNHWPVILTRAAMIAEADNIEDQAERRGPGRPWSDSSGSSASHVA